MEKLKSIFKNLGNVSFGTWVRSIASLAVVYVVMAPAFGYSTRGITVEEIWEIAERVISSVVILVAGWKNNSFTPEATEADRVLRGEATLCEFEDNDL
ncbi:MAG TPA: phage holin [Clostridia bacterium]|nr:phage holin [Clostridia bacterium]